MKAMDEDHIAKAYASVLNRQKFITEELDYSILERQKPLLQTLALMGHTGVSVFDLAKRAHVFFSANFGHMPGYGLKQTGKTKPAYWASKIHPDDYIALTQNSISVLNLFYRLPPEQKVLYKLVNEYRVINTADHFIRVIEQHQVLALDTHDQVWLALSILDISPNQQVKDGFKSQLFNFSTGEIVASTDEIHHHEKGVHIQLTPRETQILAMVKRGLLSKEISGELAISIHTVNTHRQRLLEKLGANNSMEAVIFATRLGLLPKKY